MTRVLTQCLFQGLHSLVSIRRGKVLRVFDSGKREGRSAIPRKAYASRSRLALTGALFMSESHLSLSL